MFLRAVKLYNSGDFRGSTEDMERALAEYLAVFARCLAGCEGAHEQVDFKDFYPAIAGICRSDTWAGLSSTWPAHLPEGWEPYRPCWYLRPQGTLGQSSQRPGCGRCWIQVQRGRPKGAHQGWAHRGPCKCKGEKQGVCRTVCSGKSYLVLKS